jgi:uncharacterized coiled-coil DUF342 family protein
MDWNIIIKPLLEKNMLNAKEGEIILDKKTGHVTIKHNGKYKSKTKELEARVNALLGFKNQLVKKFIELAERIDILVAGMDKIRDDTRDIKEEALNLYNDLLELSDAIDSLFEQVDNFVLDLKDFQYKEIRPHLDPIVRNLKSLLLIKANVEEFTFLSNDVNNQKVSNKQGLDKVGGGY